MPDIRKCPACSGVVSRQSTSLPIAVGARTVNVHGTYSRCGSCDEVYFAPGEMDAAMRTASATIRAELGLLQPADIKAIRDSLGLTQGEFERVLGVGEKTVVRWEKGTVFQNKATDNLLRTIRDVPAAANYLLAGAGLASTPMPWELQANDQVSLPYFDTTSPDGAAILAAAA